MNFKILLTSFIVLGFASCSTSHKITQTPDDVYYSPVKEIPDEDSYVQNEKKDEYRYNDRTYGYDQWDDRRLRLKCRSRFNRWNSFDDYSWHSSWQWGSYNWYYNVWTDTWYPVSNCSCYNGYYGYNHWSYYPTYYTPVYYASSPRPKNDIRWLNTNYNSANYGTPNRGSIKGGNNNNGSYGLDKPKNRTNDGSSKRSFTIPSSSGSSSGSSSSGSSSSKSGNGRAFRN